MRNITLPISHNCRLKHFLFFGALAFLLTPLSLTAQNAAFTWMDSVSVLENGNIIRNPGAGGMNLPQFSAIDLNGDATMDLIVFDRAGNKLMTFLNGGTTGQSDYTYAPEFESAFPADLKNFVLAADFDCDGKMDLFTSTREIGIKVYRNTSLGGNLSFASAYDTLHTDLGAGSTILLVSPKDVPAFVDVDGDGDLDVLTFDTGGTFVEYHKNMALENSTTCDHFELIRADACWGKFQESSFNQSVTLNVSCRVSPLPWDGKNPFTGRHAGSTIAAYDGDSDGDMEVLLGDLIFDGITYLHNGGTGGADLMDSMDVNFPAEDLPVAINIFPASFVLDLDNDGKKDIVVCPNAENISVNYDNVWFYKNIDAGAGVTPSFQSFRFLVDQSLDVGSASAPALFDYNGDGKLDLIVGNYSLKTSGTNVRSGLALYENVGTVTAPRFELISRDFAGINANFNPDIFGTVPTFGDLDGDGDSDMLVGDADGKIHLFTNIAASGQPADFVLAQANYAGIDVGGFAYPVLVDWNRDGLLDIVAGEWSGKLKYYQNTGTASSPSFSSTATNANLGGVDVEPICCTGNATPHVIPNPVTGKYDVLVGTESGKIHYYPEAEIAPGNWAASTLDFGGKFVGKQTTIASGDLNGDGKRDWVIGNLRGGLSFFEGDIVIGQTEAAQTELPSVALFPNPSKGELNLRVDLSVTRAMHVTVCDVMGRTIGDSHPGLTNRDLSLDLGGLQPGVYIVSVKVDGMAAVSKRWIVTR